jgi:lysophospholipase L1-like esterase
MIDCMIIGDSIAVGTQQFRKECVAYATGGLNTKQWNNKYRSADLTAGSVIISLGTNDHDGVNSFKELLAMRERVTAERVYWIMPPIKPHIQAMVEIISRNYNDTVITTNRLQADKIHPSWAGYKELGDAARNPKR